MRLCISEPDHSGFAVTLAELRDGVLDAVDHVLDVLVGEARMHREIHFALVEELGRDRALIGIVAHAAQAGEVEGRLIMQNGLDAFFLIQGLHEFITALKLGSCENPFPAPVSQRREVRISQRTHPRSCFFPPVDFY